MAIDSFSSGSGNVTRNLNRSQSELAKSFEKLSSGKRINRASDDAAGLAIADSLKADAVVLKQANRNIADASSAIEIADSALQQVGDISIRLQELAAQSANGTLSDEQRVALDTEYQQLTQEVQRIGATTEFNGQSLLGGESITVQAGDSSEASSRLSTAGVNLQQAVASVASSSIASIDSARNAVDALTSFSSSVSSSRGDLGATSARLQVASEKNESQRVSSITAESRIRDLDIAEETARSVANRIKLDTGAALGGQLNLNSRVVLDLLK